MKIKDLTLEQVTKIYEMGNKLWTSENCPEHLMKIDFYYLFRQRPWWVFFHHPIHLIKFLFLNRLEEYKQSKELPRYFFKLLGLEENS